MNILLAVDGSAYSKRMLSYLAAHDELLGAQRRYTVLTVVPLITAYAAIRLSAEAIQAYYAEQAQEVLRPVRAFAEQNRWEADVRYVVGEAGEEIALMAERDHFDLVMMGSHGHGALAGVVMGSVATRVLAQCRTPVLLIR